MLLRAVILLLSTLLSLSAGKLVSPHDAIVQTYGKSIAIDKQALTLTPEQAKAVSRSAKTELKGMKFQAFRISRASKPVAYGVLIKRKVRTRNAAVLYMINVAGTLDAVEIIAFNEPSEFIPPAQWVAQFKGKTAADALYLDQGIPNITGATMSTRVITDNSRVALAIVETVLKKQP